MKRFFPLCLLLLVMAQYVFPQQTVLATGTVKGDKGNPVPYAFIRDRPYKYATYADSAGNFKLRIAPDSYLQVLSAGYMDARVKTGNNTDFQIVLPSTGSIGGNAASSAQSTALKTTVFTQHNTADNDNQNFSYGEGAIFSAPKKEDAHGSNYLFGNWVHGFFINSADSLAQNQKYLYNYDKMGGTFLLTQDKVNAIQVNPALFKSITLVDNAGNSYAFEKIPAIDAGHYVQVLASGKKYNIYKTIATHFRRADYSSNGLSSSGNNYDEYMDEYVYYVNNLQTNAMQKISLKKKSLKEAFAADADKVNKFMADHSSSDIDDAYLSSLGAYMNGQ